MTESSHMVGIRGSFDPVLIPFSSFSPFSILGGPPDNGGGKTSFNEFDQNFPSDIKLQIPVIKSHMGACAFDVCKC